MAQPNKNVFKSPYPGFTLVEVLVVVGIFAITATLAVDVFLSTNKTSKKSVANQQVQSAMRFALESIVREIHQSTIDYTHDPGADTNYLYLRDPNGESVQFKFDSATSTLYISRGETPSWQPLLAGEVKVVRTDFYVSPLNNPFAPAGSIPEPPNEQPRVTIAISAQSSDVSLVGANPFFIQTTVVSRNYQR